MSDVLLKRPTVYLAFLLFLLTACGQENMGSGEKTPVAVTMTIPSGTAPSTAIAGLQPKAVVPAPIASVSLSVTDSGQNVLTSTAVSVTPGETLTISLDVPSGPARTFAAQALDAQGNVLYQGQSDPVDLSPGILTAVTIQMVAIGETTTTTTIAGGGGTTTTTTTISTTTSTLLISGGGGTLTVANAPASVGGSFVADTELTNGTASGTTASVFWFEDAVSNHAEEVDVAFDTDTNNVINVIFVSADGSVGTGWICAPSLPSGCAGVSVDRIKGAVAFESTVLTDITDANPPPPITLNGTLNFTPF